MMLCKIQVSQEIHRLPRPLQEKAKWKATEWRSFLLFYSFPCLHGILPTKYMDHFLLFVRSIYTLLNTEITDEQIRQCEEDLLKFVGQTELLYGDECITFNVHAVLHITMSVRQSGPLWATSAFPFENGIYLCKVLINGPKGVDQQIAKKWLQMMTYESSVCAISQNVACKQYCRELYSNRSIKAMRTVETEDGNVRLIGASYEDKKTVLYIQTLFNDAVHPTLYNRCIYKNTMIHSTAYKRPIKTNDTTVMLQCKSIIQILHFVLINEKCYILAVRCLCEPIESLVEVSHMTKIIRKEKKSLLYGIEEIERKILVVEIEGSIRSYACQLPNTLEIQ